MGENGGLVSNSGAQLLPVTAPGKSRPMKKGKRGRPPRRDAEGDPVRSPIYLFRALSMLKHFGEARNSGLNRTEAIRAAVTATRVELPNVPGVNKAEVERVLTEFQPKVGADGFKLANALQVKAHANGGAHARAFEAAYVLNVPARLAREYTNDPEGFFALFRDGRASIKRARTVGPVGAVFEGPRRVTRIKLR